MKTARKIFRVGLNDLTPEKARIYYEESISQKWRDDDGIKNAYNEYLNLHDNKEANI